MEERSSDLSPHSTLIVPEGHWLHLSGASFVSVISLGHLWRGMGIFSPCAAVSASFQLMEDGWLQSYFESWTNLFSLLLLLVLFQHHIFLGKTILLQALQASVLFVISQSPVVVSIPNVPLSVVIHESDFFLLFLAMRSLPFSSKGQLPAWGSWDRIWEAPSFILTFATGLSLLIHLRSCPGSFTPRLLKSHLHPWGLALISFSNPGQLRASGLWHSPSFLLANQSTLSWAIFSFSLILAKCTQ